MEDLRTKINQLGIDYYLTFAQMMDAKRTNDGYLADYFNTLPYKEKILVRPDWQPPAEDPFYPDIEPEY